MYHHILGAMNTFVWHEQGDGVETTPQRLSGQNDNAITTNLEFYLFLSSSSDRVVTVV